MTNNPLSIRLLPGGHFFSLPPGADYIARLEDAVLSHLETQEEIPPTITCEVHTSRMTLVPAHTNTKETEAMFRFTLPKSENEEKILIDTLPHSGTEHTDTEEILLVYAIDLGFYNFLQRNLAQVSFCHPLKALHEQYRADKRVSPTAEAPQIPTGTQAQIPAATAPTSLIAHIGAQSMTLLAYKDGRLLLANSYEDTSASNRTYYLLNTWQQLALDQLQDQLLLDGDPTEVEKLRTHVAPYIKQTLVLTTTKENPVTKQ